MISKSRAPTLLMTATIDPRGMPMVARADPQLRLRDYEWALSGWLASGSVGKIVFCENSGHALDSLRRIAAAHPNIEVEFLALPHEQPELSRGKGFAELGIIKLALVQSRLIAASALLLKCTGRLRVQNSAHIVRQVTDGQFDVMCTLKRRRRFAESRLFAATPAFMREYLIPRANQIDDSTGVYLEHVLARAVCGAVDNGEIWRPFPTLPRIAGISGTRGLVLTDSLATSLFKAGCHRVRNLLRGN